MRAYEVAKKATNQNLIPRPCDVNVHLTGDKSKLGPQLMHQFISPPPPPDAKPRPTTRPWPEPGDSHQLPHCYQQSGLLQRDILCPSPPLDPSECGLAGVLLPPLAWRCPRNPAHASRESPGEDADLWRSALFLGNDAGSRAFRASTPTRPSCRDGNRSDLAFPTQ